MQAVEVPGYVGWLLLPALLLGHSCAREAGVSLKGQWQITKGFELSWLTTGPARESRPVTLPANLRQLPEFADFHGTVTLRRKLPDQVQQWARNALPVAFESGMASDVATYYLNNSPIGSRGSLDPYRTGIQQRMFSIVGPGLLKENAPNYLTIVLSVPKQPSTGHKFEVLGPEIRLGPAGPMAAEYRNQVAVALVLIALYVCVGAYHLLLVARRPKELHNLFFGLFAILFGMFFAANTYARDALFPENSELRIKFDHGSLHLLTPMFLMFVLRFFRVKDERLGVAALGLGVCTATMSLFASPRVTQEILFPIFLFSSPPLIACALFIVGRETYRRNIDALLMVAGMLFMLLGFMYDNLVNKGYIATDFISQYTFLAFVLSIAMILANRFVRVHNSVEELNLQLEERVATRTQLLNESLTKVQDLKAQQDGDYFLTSLLIQPLAGNHVHSSTVSVEMLVRQKKRFFFRKWEAEIGGDYCSAHQIVLRGRSYVVFVNGDAMGKSMQGAGGALVLGSVFRAVIARTLASAREQDTYPEQWLKRCYLELQHVFVTFDGSMLTSAVIGMIDERTGLMYHLNAEHPLVTLYRGGKADFLEDSSGLLKIGMAGANKSLEIRTFHLQRGDVVFIGSDGRDDILRGHDDSGNRIINKDEWEFLRHVEAAGGRLGDLEASLRRSGELTDDLSIVRIEYVPDAFVPESQRGPEYRQRYEAALIGAQQALDSNAPERALKYLESACALLPDDPETIRLLAETNRSLGNLEAYAQCLERQVDLTIEPLASFRASVAFKKLGHFRKAADLGERCRLRDPSIVRNLLNLSEIYQLLGDGTRARSLLSEALAFEPDNDLAHKVQARIDGMQGPAARRPRNGARAEMGFE